MSEDRGESVFSRWSRRKLAAREEQQNLTQPEELTQADSAAEDQSLEPVESPEPEAPPLTDADMPDIETLTEESDYSPFMSPGVSEELRKLALRKMFQGSVFNIRDGLDEYDDDFTSFEKLGDIVTSDMKHRIEMEQQKLREKLEAEEALEDDEMEVMDDEADLEADEQLAEQQQNTGPTGDDGSLEVNPEEEKHEQP